MTWTPSPSPRSTVQTTTSWPRARSSPATLRTCCSTPPGWGKYDEDTSATRWVRLADLSITRPSYRLRPTRRHRRFDRSDHLQHGQVLGLTTRTSDVSSVPGVARHI